MVAGKKQEGKHTSGYTNFADVVEITMRDHLLGSLLTHFVEIDVHQELRFEKAQFTEAVSFAEKTHKVIIGHTRNVMPV